MQNACSKLTRKASDGRCPKTPVTGRSLIMVRSVTAVPPKMPEKGMKGTQYRRLPGQLLTVIEPCSTQGPAAPPSCTRRHPSNSGKGDLDSIRAFRQKNSRGTRKALTFCTDAAPALTACCLRSRLAGRSSTSPRTTTILGSLGISCALCTHLLAHIVRADASVGTESARRVVFAHVRRHVSQLASTLNPTRTVSYRFQSLWHVAERAALQLPNMQ